MAINERILRQRAQLESRIRTRPELSALRRQLSDRKGQRQLEIRGARDTGRILQGNAQASKPRLNAIYDAGQSRINDANKFTAAVSPDPAQELGPASALAQALAGEQTRTQTNMANERTAALTQAETDFRRAGEGAAMSEKQARASYDADASKIYGAILDTLRTGADVEAKSFQDLWDDAEKRDFEERKFAWDQEMDVAKLAADAADNKTPKPAYSRDKRISWRDAGREASSRVMSTPVNSRGEMVFTDKDGNKTYFKVAKFNGNHKAIMDAQTKLWRTIINQGGKDGFPKVPEYVAKGIAEMRMFGSVSHETAKRIRKDTGNPAKSYGFKVRPKKKKTPLDLVLR